MIKYVIVDWDTTGTISDESLREFFEEVKSIIDSVPDTDRIIIPMD